MGDVYSPRRGYVALRLDMQMEAGVAEAREHQSRGKPLIKMLIWVFVVFAVVAVLVKLALWGYDWPGSGFNEYPVTATTQHAKTLWDWFDLLLVPAVLAGGGILFSYAERRNERETATRQAALDRELADKRADADRGRADDVLRQALVQDYLDRMSELLLDKSLASSVPDDLVMEVARARTLTVLRGLGEDGARKGYIVQFLYETGLIKGKKAIVELEGASLERADLHSVALREANLSGANLSNAQLFNVDLRGAWLAKANFDAADLTHAKLCDADLSEAWLCDARLNQANLSRATLIGRYPLARTDLSKSNLTGAQVENWQLELALSLKGATMPDGSKYEGAPPTRGETLGTSSIILVIENAEDDCPPGE